ncbi:hypothetical protein [Polymorphospora rubra]|uniref:hypothetical protein n=1 Tax=Polymorphospora rubra TaxID=338584 RepID=UPI0033F88719
MTVDDVRPPRPAQVTVAFWLLLATAVLLLGIAGLAVAEAVRYDGQIDRAAALVPDADPVEVGDERTANVVGAVLTGAPALLLAVFLVVAAVPMLRGSNVGRILVFVAGGTQLLWYALQSCSGLLFLPMLLLPADPGFLEDEAPDDEFPDDEVPWEDLPWEESEFLETLYAEPEPFAGLSFLATGVGSVVVLALTGAVVLLLALPPAHRWFVPRAAQQPPPPPPPAWPAYPGGYPMPYLVCPDPSAHFRPAADKPAAAAPPGSTGPAPSTSDPG